MNFTRYVRELIRGKSLWRSLFTATLEYAIQSRPALLEFARVLEIGSAPASHYRVLPHAWKITRSNYILMDGISHIVDGNGIFPFRNNAFDGVICFNSLYAVEDIGNCLAEALRVSRKFFIFTLPHAISSAPHPRDFHRGTMDGIAALFHAYGGSENSFHYEAIPVGGSFTTAMGIIDIYIPSRIIRLPFALLALFCDALDSLWERKCPLQYLIIVEKHIV